MREVMVVVALVACSKGPVKHAGPEQDIIDKLAVAVTDEPRKAVDLYDVELRQRIDVYEEVTRAPGEQRVKLLEAAMPRVGDGAALDTLRAELAAAVRGGDASQGRVR